MIDRIRWTGTPWAAGFFLVTLGGCGSQSSGPSGPPADDAAPTTAPDAATGDATFADGGQPTDAGVLQEAATPIGDGMAQASDGGILVCAGNIKKTCADCTSCDQCPGCALMPSPGSCTGTPSASACSKCPSDCTGCLGCTVQSTCTYFDAGVNSCAECATVTSSGCYYAACGGCTPGNGGSSCTGTLTPCSAFNAPDAGPCQGQIDCELVPTGCTGTLATCASLDETDCATQNGCSWTTSAGMVCRGTIQSCEQMDATHCTSFSGCSLVQANPRATCDSSAPGCFACGAAADGGASGACAAPIGCCGATASAQSCQPLSGCGNDPFQTSCDGPEDCVGGQCCASLQVSSTTSTGSVQSGKTACASSCPVDSASSTTVDGTDSIACHSSADCGNVADQFQVPYPVCCRAPGYPVGACVSQTFQAIFMGTGVTCN
ncbi:MAG TPA: hypothetical protein VKU41_14425 [Polyangiaceae bacterium]|nr:hypothetical protein [Polyangiaceae bacterium]